MRIASALVLAPIVLALVYLGGWPFAALVALAAGLMLSEWRAISAPRLPAWRIAPPLACLIAGAIVQQIGETAIALALVAIAALIAAWLACPFAARRWALLGPVYVGLPCLALIWLRALPDQGLGLVLWLLVLVWACDSFAYFAGRTIGGPKLAPRISPNKTWSGLVGGIGGAGLAGGILAAASAAAPVIAAALASAVLALVSQVGDLAESALKRRFGVKDSGQLIPGHGGALDRLDALLFAAPAAALLVWLFDIEVPRWP